jgi:hypothetical protein
MHIALKFLDALGACAAIAFSTASVTDSAAQSDAAPIYGVAIPPGFRDWAFISMARVGGPLNDMRVKLGNDVSIGAFREGKTVFPDGTIIARLAWNQATSAENNDAVRSILERSFGADAAQKLLAESFVAGPPTNVQFMVKDSRSTPRLAAGVSLSSPAANLTVKRYTKPAFPATCRPRIATLSSPATRRRREAKQSRQHQRHPTRTGRLVDDSLGRTCTVRARIAALSSLSPSL